MSSFKQLVTVLVATVALTGCGTGVAQAPVAQAPAALTASAFKEAAYEKATLRQTSSFLDREGSKANDGKRFQVTGKMFHNAPDNFLEGWGAQLSHGGDYTWIIVSKSFLTRGMAERFFEKIGSGKDETVTVYYRVKAASSTKDRIKLEAVRRANGTLVTL